MTNVGYALTLAMRYSQLAEENNITTAKQLSALTYKLRESGEDIPYLAVATTNVNYTPVPLAKQKTWAWLRNQSIGEGYIGFWLHVLPNGYSIEVYELGQRIQPGPHNKTNIFYQEFTF